MKKSTAVAFVGAVLILAGGVLLWIVNVTGITRAFVWLAAALGLGFVTLSVALPVPKNEDDFVIELEPLTTCVDCGSQIPQLARRCAFCGAVQPAKSSLA